MYAFLLKNRAELVARCKGKVAMRPRHVATEEQLAKGVLLFLEQLIRTLRAEGSGATRESLAISGASGGDAVTLSEMGVSAAEHGKVLLDLGFTVDQVVHDYGDLCQAITDLAVERDAPFSVPEFRTLNRCLDNAIADAVSGFALQRDAAIARQRFVDENQRLGFMVHELRNDLQTATLAFGALAAGKLAIGGSTSGMLKRSLESMAALLTEAISEVRAGSIEAAIERFPVALLLEDAAMTTLLHARGNGCTLTARVVDPSLQVRGNRMLLAAALVNLLQNAFKFTQPGTDVVLEAYRLDERVVIDVRDHCGGLPAGAIEHLFRPFEQAGPDRTGLGLGLSIARRSIEADGGTLRVTDLPGSGCIFTVELPLVSSS